MGFLDRFQALKTKEQAGCVFLALTRALVHGIFSGLWAHCGAAHHTGTAYPDRESRREYRSAGLGRAVAGTSCE